MLDNPSPLILIDKYDIPGVSILLGIWFERSNLVEIKNTILMDIQERFAEEGIEIPYPKRDVYIKGIVERESSERKLSEKGPERKRLKLKYRFIPARF